MSVLFIIESLKNWEKSNIKRNYRQKLQTFIRKAYIINVGQLRL